MTWVCEHCGNKEDFDREESGICNYTTCSRVDSDDENGGSLDIGDTDYDGYDTRRSLVLCGNCGYEAIWKDEDDSKLTMKDIKTCDRGV